MSWPTLESGQLDETDQTFREMAGKYPHIEPLRELRVFAVEVAAQRSLGWERPPQPRAVVGLWHQDRPQRAWRIAIRVRAGQVAAIPDHPAAGASSGSPGFCQQEVRIAAVLSGDSALLEACESGDVYLALRGSSASCPTA